jgi:hypothetical protein
LRGQPHRRDGGKRRIAVDPNGLRGDKFRLLFENMLNGFAYCRMIYHEGKPTDFVYLDVNKSFGELTGLNGVVGKKVSEIIPGIRQSNPELFEIYGKVASTGKSEQFETVITTLGLCFHISVYSPRAAFSSRFLKI